jgi:transcription elongation factor GreA-like protein/transcription elongation GreA/GreB family factor
MSYLKDFLTQINNRDFHKFLVLWEEYCASDTVDAEEFSQLLKAISASDLAKHFSQIIETAIPLWRKIDDAEESYEILRLLIDLQTTNSPQLAEITFEALQKRHGQDPKYNERLRILGLRNKDLFQGAISKYELLAHMVKGNMVFHGGGWGTGEITDVSMVREHLVIEFENVAGRKDLSFSNAFKTLIPLSQKHFMARRFADPDKLEEEGRKDPVGLIKLLLHDMGPQTAADIKNELCELVIPEQDWTKWWQGARAKIKKDPMIETPDSLKEAFHLRKAELTTEDKLKQAMGDVSGINEVILSTYNFVRDTPAALKDPETKEKLQNTLLELLENKELSADNELQIYLLLDQFFGYTIPDNRLVKLIQNSSNIEQIVMNIDIQAFKKRALIAIKEHRQDWNDIFQSLLFKISQTQLRDFILKELNQGSTKKNLEKKLGELLETPGMAPDLFVWYFVKLLSDEEEKIPYQNKEGINAFFESFLILYSIIENQSEYKDLLKKMYNILSGKRYALVRQLLQGTSIDYTKEFLLLASKCQTLSDHDIKILRSLAEVVHPSLGTKKEKESHNEEDGIIWTTEEGYLKVQDRIRHIGTVEVVENAREIEAARALGDLRENSEFKFAQERRVRLQSELKTLSDQLGRARIITPHDVHSSEVGIGSVIKVKDSKGKNLTYTILGPWDADADNNILSFNSKLAQEMLGKKKGESFHFKNESFEITNLSSAL